MPTSLELDDNEVDIYPIGQKEAKAKAKRKGQSKAIDKCTQDEMWNELKNGGLNN